MHSFYLRNCTSRTSQEPGGIELNGVPIDLAKVTVPSYFISTIDDHIAPWKGTYLGAQRLSGPVRFVLGGSGHIAGIVNPPAANKYGYWVSEDAGAQPSAAKQLTSQRSVVAQATQHQGSWWTIGSAGRPVEQGPESAGARSAKGRLKPLEDAPAPTSSPPGQQTQTLPPRLRRVTRAACAGRRRTGGRTRDRARPAAGARLWPSAKAPRQKSAGARWRGRYAAPPRRRSR